MYLTPLPNALQWTFSNDLRGYTPQPLPTQQI